MSLLGAVFYSILAIMTARRNPVFLEHKVGMNQFTWTDEEINAKFWDIAFSAIIMAVSMALCCGSGFFFKVREDNLREKVQKMRVEEA